jgi:16S rRNA (cytosine967-C5)-methyltransferase
LKIEIVKDIFSIEKLFPIPDQISDEINFKEFSLSFLIQPKLFIRTRPGHKNAVIQKLKSAEIFFQQINESCIAFSNTEKVNDVIRIDKEAVIQDYNSQKTLDLITERCEYPLHPVSVWDCCAASGGKSILAFDLLGDIELTVSDTRKNILENLHKRFAKAGIKNYNFFTADLSVFIPKEMISKRVDLIIADVPCSGSGTWSRTAEHLHFFSKEKIDKYLVLQQKIVSNVVQCLSGNGYLLYITCSVFKEENEENVRFFQKNLNLQLIKSEYLIGYEMQADTLFAALLKRKNGK